MSGLFLSYSRADRAVADEIIRALRAVGVAVWWDEDMRGVDWQHELEQRINDLAGVMVLWTPSSAESNPVRDEARLALETDKLINVLIGVPKPPFPYDRINGLPLDGWAARDPHRGWTRLIETVEEMVVQVGGARPGDITVAQAMREQDIQRRKEAIAATDEARRGAQRHLDDAADAVKAAHSGLEHVQEQLQQVAELRVTPAILKAAQQEFEVARAAREEAEAQRKAARNQLEDTQRELVKLKDELEALLSIAIQPPALPSRRPPPSSRLRPAPRDLAPEPLPEPEPPPPPPPPPAAAVQVAEPPAEKPAPKPRRAARPVAAPAPAPEPAASAPAVAAPAAAPAAAAVEHEPMPKVAPPPGLTRSPAVRIGAIAAVVGVVAIGAVMLLTHHTPGAATATPSAAEAVAQPGASAEAASTAAFAGDWAPQGFTCSDPVKIAIDADTLTMTSSGQTVSETIQPGATATSLKAQTASGLYTYTLKRKTLSMADPTGAAMKMNSMRWLSIAAGLGLALAASVACAQDPKAMLCARYDTAWARVAGSSDLHAVQNTAGSIPSICPVKAEADKRVAELKAEQARAKPAAPAPEKQAAETPPAPTPAEPPKPPPPPCSVEAVDALDPDLPADGPDASAAGRKRQDYAERFDRRAAAFVACKDTADAAQTFSIAVRQDPQNFSVIADKAQFDAAQSDWQGAIADNTTAIALKDQAPPGVNILSVYASRAEAYDELKEYPQEIADLKQVVDHFNDELHDTLQPFDIYKEALAKAYYRSSDPDDAEAMLLTVDESHMDWEDLAFLGQVRAQGKIWDSAIEALTKALQRMPADPALKARHTALEVALAQAYQARGRQGDARGAYDADNAALADDPDNADAKAGLAALGPMLTKPTFTEPALDTLVMPAGVSDLDTDNPPPFCSQEVKNDYLDSVKSASNTVNANMTTLGEAIDSLLKTRASYDASGLLTYSEKLEDLSLFDAEWKKLDTENTQLRNTGDALLRFFARIRDNDSLVHVGTCKSG